MNKKKYVTPSMKAFKLRETDIICTSDPQVVGLEAWSWVETAETWW